MTELEQLIAEQAEDMRSGHRVFTEGVPYFDYLPVEGYKKKSPLRQIPSVLEHGKLSTYTNYRCRCSLCKAANATYHRNYQRKKRMVLRYEAA